MPFKVLNSRTVIIAGERVLSEENSNYLSLDYFYLLLLNKAWEDIPKNKVEKIYELLDINANSSLGFSKDIVFLSPRNGSQSPPFDYLTEEFSIGLKSIESFFTKPNKNSFSFKYLKNSYQSYIDANQKFGVINLLKEILQM